MCCNDKQEYVSKTQWKRRKSESSGRMLLTYKAKRKGWRAKEVFGTRSGWIVRHVHAHDKAGLVWMANGAVLWSKNGGERALQRDRERETGGVCLI